MSQILSLEGRGVPQEKDMKQVKTSEVSFNIASMRCRVSAMRTWETSLSPSNETKTLPGGILRECLSQLNKVFNRRIGLEGFHHSELNNEVFG